MSVHLQRELTRLKRQLLSLCAVVEEQVRMSVRALLDRDLQLSHHVQDRDSKIDQMEVEVEEECLKILALYHPVAIDLRVVVSALKINNDLERIGDLAVNIARKVEGVLEIPHMETPFDFPGMWEKTQAMLSDSMDALVNMNSALAHDVCVRDDEVDRMKHEIGAHVIEMIEHNPTRTRPLLRLLAASRNLERIADLATDIAEDVIYMVEGRIIRHRAELQGVVANDGE